MVRCCHITVCSGGLNFTYFRADLHAVEACVKRRQLTTEYDRDAGGGEDASGSPTIHYPSPLQEDWRSLFGQLKGVRFSNGAGDTVRVTSAGDTVAAETDDRGKTDKERLQEKVKTYGLVERQVKRRPCVVAVGLLTVVFR